MNRSALWIGDRVTGRNRYTGEWVSGRLLSLDTSGLDGVTYATVEQPLGTTAVIEASSLHGPRACYRPVPRGEWGDDQVTCANCGRPIYPNGPYDTDRLTHRPERVASRYR